MSRGRRVGQVLLVVGLIALVATGSLFAEEMVDISKYKKSPPYKVAFDIY